MVSQPAFALEDLATTEWQRYMQEQAKLPPEEAHFSERVFLDRLAVAAKQQGLAYDESSIATAFAKSEQRRFRPYVEQQPPENTFWNTYLTRDQWWPKIIRGAKALAAATLACAVLYVGNTLRLEQHIQNEVHAMARAQQTIDAQVEKLHNQAVQAQLPATQQENLETHLMHAKQQVQATKSATTKYGTDRETIEKRITFNTVRWRIAAKDRISLVAEEKALAQYHQHIKQAKGIIRTQHVLAATSEKIQQSYNKIIRINPPPGLIARADSALLAGAQHVLRRDTIALGVTNDIMLDFTYGAAIMAKLEPDFPERIEQLYNLATYSTSIDQLNEMNLQGNVQRAIATGNYALFEHVDQQIIYAREALKQEYVVILKSISGTRIHETGRYAYIAEAVGEKEGRIFSRSIILPAYIDHTADRGIALEQVDQWAFEVSDQKWEDAHADYCGNRRGECKGGDRDFDDDVIGYKIPGMLFPLYVQPHRKEEPTDERLGYARANGMQVGETLTRWTE